MSYTYEDPIKKGYKQFTLTKQQHNQLFPKRQMKWYDKCEYYYNEHGVLLHKFFNWKGVLAETLLFPFTLLFVGLSNTKEYLNDLKKMYNQKKYGDFSSDFISSRSATYSGIMEAVGS